MAMKPVSKKLNEKQKEILARKLGYDGPMNMFEEFVKSDAAMGAKYNSVIGKYMARGGMAKKYAEGGDVRKYAVGGSVNELGYITYNIDKLPEGVRANQYNILLDKKGNLYDPNVPQPPKAPPGGPHSMTNLAKYANDWQTRGGGKLAANVNAAGGWSNYVKMHEDYYKAFEQYQKDFTDYNKAKSDASGQPSFKFKGQTIPNPSYGVSRGNSTDKFVPKATTAIKQPIALAPARDTAAQEARTAEIAKQDTAEATQKAALEQQKTASEALNQGLPAPTTTAATTTPTPTTTATTTFAPTAAPAPPVVPQLEAATVQQAPDQFVTGQAAPTQAATVQPATVSTAATVADVAPKEAATVEAVTATPGVATALESVQPVTGVVSPEAQVQAQTMDPRTTAVSDLQAATGEATMVQAPAPRTVQEGEMISGPTVDMGRVEETLAQAQPAQGEVTPEMTVQFQLQKLTENFDATNPPTWAAGAIRNVNSVLTQRGLGASSLAGQAVLQAALESALPIAAADAKVYQEMGIQNLSNRQQMAVLTAQQRAAFLGQEFDQAFQTRVTNAATISEIANINFTAEQQIALENARLTNTVNLANLSNQQALIMAEAAQIANLETANLNNRQQAQVLNAQAFLQMDMANLANEQQTELFKAQSMVNSLLTDAAAENAARQFNASSINQVNQFYDGLSTQIKQFNAAQINGINQFNVSQVNAVAEFNATAQNARDQFNAEYRRIIDQSNAEWRRNIALADTAAVNRANEINAANAMGITTIEYNNTWQTYRDQMEMAWKTGESSLDRENQLAMQVLQKQATIEAAKYQVEVAKYEALGKLAAVGLDKAMSGGLTTAAAALGISGVARAGGAPAGTKTAAEKIMDGDSLPTFNGAVYSYNDALGMEVFSPEYEQFISNTYGTEIGSEQSEWLAEQDAWFYDGM